MYYHNELSRNFESELLISARNQMIYSWIIFLITTIILNVCFIAEWWSIAIRTSMIVYPIYKSVKFYGIKKQKKKLKVQDSYQKTNVKNTRFSFNSNSYNSSRIAESEDLITARKQMIFAWIVFIVFTIILNVFFIGEGWSIGTRSAMIVYPAYKSVKYGKIKEEEKKLRAQGSPQKNYINATEASYYRKHEQSTIITSHSKETSSFCPFCCSKYERETVYCSACGTDLKLGA